MQEGGDMEARIDELTELFQKLVALGETQLSDNWTVAMIISQPRQENWNELKRVVKYVKGTINSKLVLGKIDQNVDILHGYADASFADKNMGRKSISGSVFFRSSSTEV